MVDYAAGIYNPGTTLNKFPAESKTSTARYTFTVKFDLAGGVAASTPEKTGTDLWAYLLNLNNAGLTEDLWTYSNNSFTRVCSAKVQTFSCGTLANIYDKITKTNYYFSGFSSESVNVYAAETVTVTATYGQYTFKAESKQGTIATIIGGCGSAQISLSNITYYYGGIRCVHRGWSTEDNKILYSDAIKEYISATETERGPESEAASYEKGVVITFPRYAPAYQDADEKAVWVGSTELSRYAVWYQYGHVLRAGKYNSTSKTWTEIHDVVNWTYEDSACNVSCPGVMNDGVWVRGYKEVTNGAVGDWVIFRNYDETTDFQSWWQTEKTINKDYTGTKYNSCEDVPVSVKADSIRFFAVQYTTFLGGCKYYQYTDDSGNQVFYTETVKGNEPIYLELSLSDHFTVVGGKLFRGWSKTQSAVNDGKYYPKSMYTERTLILGEQAPETVNTISDIFPNDPERTTASQYVYSTLYPTYKSRSEVPVFHKKWRYYFSTTQDKYSPGIYPQPNNFEKRSDDKEYNVYSPIICWSINEANLNGYAIETPTAEESAAGVTAKYSLVSTSDCIAEGCDIYVHKNDFYIEVDWYSEQSFGTYALLFEAKKTRIPIASPVYDALGNAVSCAGKDAQLTDILMLKSDSDTDAPLTFVQPTSSTTETYDATGDLISSVTTTEYWQFQGWAAEANISSDVGTDAVKIQNSNGIADTNYYPIWWKKPAYRMELSNGRYLPSETEYTYPDTYIPLTTDASENPVTYNVSLTEAWNALSTGVQIDYLYYDGVGYSSETSTIPVKYTLATGYERVLKIEKVGASRPTVYLSCDTEYFAQTPFTTVDATTYLSAEFDSNIVSTEELILSMLKIPDSERYKYAIESMYLIKKDGSISAVGYDSGSGEYSFTLKSTESTDTYVTLVPVLRKATYTLNVIEGDVSVALHPIHGEEFVCTNDDLAKFNPKNVSILGFAFSTPAEGSYVYDFPAVGETSFHRANGEYVYDGEELTVVPVWGNMPTEIRIVSPTAEVQNMLGSIDIRVQVSINNSSRYNNTNVRVGLYSVDEYTETDGVATPVKGNLISVGTQLPAGVTEFTLIPEENQYKDYMFVALGNTAKSVTVDIAARTLSFSGTYTLWKAINKESTEKVFLESVPKDICSVWYKPDIATFETNIANKSAATGEIGYTFAGWTTETKGTESISEISWVKPTAKGKVDPETVYAMWAFSIRYRLGGGYWDGDAPKAYTSQTTYWGSKVLAAVNYTISKTPLHKKYVFDHWMLNGQIIESNVARLALGRNTLVATWKYPKSYAHLPVISYTLSPLEHIESTNEDNTTTVGLYAQLRYNFDWKVMSSNGSDMLFGDGMILYGPANMISAPDTEQTVFRLLYGNRVLWTRSVFDEATDGRNEITVSAEEIPPVNLKKDSDGNLITELADTFSGDIQLLNDHSNGAAKKNTDGTFTLSAKHGTIQDFSVVPDSAGASAVVSPDTTTNVAIMPVSENDYSMTWLRVENSESTTINCWFDFKPYKWESYQINTDRSANTAFTRVSMPYISASCAANDINPNDTILNADAKSRYGSIYVAARAPAGKYVIVFHNMVQADGNSEARTDRYYILINVVNLEYDAPLCVIHKYIKDAATDKLKTSAYDQYDESTYSGNSATGELQHTLYLSSPGMTNISVTALNRSFQAQVTSIPILTKSSEYNYCIDLGTRENITFTVSRTEPKNIDNNSKDQTKWSNGVWYQHVKKFFDEWQNLNYGADGRRSGGYNLIYDPGNGYAFPVMNKNVFMSNQLSYQYNRAILDLQFSFTVATMTPKTAENLQKKTYTFYTDEQQSDIACTKTVFGNTMILPASIVVNKNDTINQWQMCRVSTDESTGYTVTEYCGEPMYAGAQCVCPGLEQDSNTTYFFFGIIRRIEYAVIYDTPGTYTFSISEFGATVGVNFQEELNDWEMSAYVVGGGGAGAAVADNYYSNSGTKLHVYAIGYNSSGEIKISKETRSEVNIGGGGSSGGCTSKTSSFQREWFGNQFKVTVGSGAKWTTEDHGKNKVGTASESTISYMGASQIGFGTVLSALGGLNGTEQTEGNVVGNGSMKGGDKNKIQFTGTKDGWSWKKTLTNTNSMQAKGSKSAGNYEIEGVGDNGGIGGYAHIEKDMTTGQYYLYLGGSGGGGADFYLDLSSVQANGHVYEQQIGTDGYVVSDKLKDNPVMYSQGGSPPKSGPWNSYESEYDNGISQGYTVAKLSNRYLDITEGTNVKSWKPRYGGGSASIFPWYPNSDTKYQKWTRPMPIDGADGVVVLTFSKKIKKA